MNSPKRFVLIDGYGFVFRAYHSLPPLTRPDGTPVGAVYGFCNMLLKQLAELHADYLAVVLDAGQKTFRHDIYAAYKANRPPAPEDLVPQFPLIRKTVEAFNIPVLEQVGFEADDLIATMATKANQQGIEVVIVSSDKDLTQLINEQTSLYDPLKSKWVKAEQVHEKYGVYPPLMRDLLSLAGDSSDNIPGVPGIGPKTAAELLNQYGSLEGIYEHLDQIKQPKRKQTLFDHHQNALLSQKLVTLHTQMDIEFDAEQFKIQSPEVGRLESFLAEQGFRSLAERVHKRTGSSLLGTASHSPVSITQHTMSIGTFNQGPKHVPTLSYIKTNADWEQCLEHLKECGQTAISLDYQDETIMGIAFASPLHKSYYVSYRTPSSEVATGQIDWLSVPQESPDISDLNFAITNEQLSRLLEDAAILKYAHDVKLILHRLAGTTIHAIHDIELLSYISSAGLYEHDLDSLKTRFSVLYDTLDWVMTPDISETRLEASRQKAQDALAIATIYPLLKEQVILNKQWTLFTRIEMPLAFVLYDMETTGICVNPQQLQALSSDLTLKIATLEKHIFELAGTTFNIGSPKQLGEVLYDQLNLPGAKKKSKAGAYPTHAEILEDLALQGYEIADSVLAWRHLSKLKSTYADALLKKVRMNHNRIHTVFAMATTSTGRLSSHDPNLQNIPIRTEEGQKIRAAFVAQPGCVLISADYSQIELRLLACMAGIKTLEKALKEGQDIHTLTASQVFGVELDDVTPELRRHAKAINFGIIYGLSAFGLANQLKIDRTSAASTIQTYFNRYPGIAEYIEVTKAQASQNHYVTTLWGRRCYLKDINSNNPNLKNFSERAAINAPLQGTAADIIKKAMIRLHQAIIEKKLSSKIVLQVHDELLLEVPESEINQTKQLVIEIMEHVISLSVPLTVEIGVGPDWQNLNY
ncbi:MAG: DNA polymerase I [Alphaproteobacteria bacterium]|nr:DNA polymerase I [Alphaproteobacteria bacterium]